jgi:hypothetical protein
MVVTESPDRAPTVAPRRAAIKGAGGTRLLTVHRLLARAERGQHRAQVLDEVELAVVRRGQPACGDRRPRPT